MQDFHDVLDKIAGIYGISTFKRWLNRYRQDKNLKPILEELGRKRKLEESNLEQHLVESSPSITLRELSEYFEKKNKIPVGHSVLFIILNWRSDILLAISQAPILRRLARQKIAKLF